jgi:glyoxylase I family protein
VSGSRVREVRGDPEMHKVNGIGGFFFTAPDPDVFGDWYRDHLGIERVTAELRRRGLDAGGGTVLAPA